MGNWPRLGVECQVGAPSRVPTKAGDRVKTDRRDAEKLARSHGSEDLTAAWVPDAAHEALRDLVRVREDAKQDQLRARHRLGKFLLRHGKHPEGSRKAWTGKYMEWLQRQVPFEQAALEAPVLDYVHEVRHQAERISELEKAIDAATAGAPPQIRAVIEALQTLREVAKTAAVSIVAEVGSFSRFESSPARIASSQGASLMTTG